MKSILHCAILLGMSACLPIKGEEPQRAEEPWNEALEIPVPDSLKKPLESKELRKLASSPTFDDHRLMELILRAGIEKDNSFQDLLKMPKLREHANVALALSAYDYMLNRSEAALDHILAYLAAEDIGADSDAIAVLGTVDEWDRSIRAFRKHFVQTDGAGGEAKIMFRVKRAYLYPNKYAEMREAIEAPITWGEPLLLTK